MEQLAYLLRFSSSEYEYHLSAVEYYPFHVQSTVGYFDVVVFWVVVEAVLLICYVEFHVAIL